MSSLAFLNSTLLWGLGLASIPLIIHFLFRRKFRQIEWAPMRYLKLTIQRNRRRIQLEQLLLLLLRTALLIVLVAVIARPVLSASGLTRWFTDNTRTSHLLLLDDSLSMELATSGKSAFQRAVELAAQAVEQMNPKDRLTLAVTSRIDTPLLREVDLVDRSEALNLLATLQPTETLTAWAATLQTVDQLLQSSTFPTRTVTLFTDLRRVGWEEEIATPPGWNGDRLKVRIIDVGAIGQRQLSLERLERTDRLAVSGTPVAWEATIRNASSQPVDNLEATWIIDGQPTQVTLPPVTQGESVKLPFTAVFQEAGLHHVSLKLPFDELSGDNQRWDVVAVKDNLRMVLVDGEPSADQFQGETDFLGLALSLAIGDSRSFQVETVTESELISAARSNPDLMVLANVSGLDASQAEQLRKLVQAGMGLMVFPGDQIDPENYNRLLFAEGTGLLPAALDTPFDEVVTGLMLEENASAAIDALRQLNPAVLGRIKINKRFQVRLSDSEQPDVRVLARWNDAAASPALLEKSVGRGHVLLWTITADKSWSDWPTEPSYVLAMRESAKSISRSDTGVNAVVAGAPLRSAVSSDRQIVTPVIEAPNLDEPKPLILEAATKRATPEKSRDDVTSDEDAQHLAWFDTARAGLYRMNWRETPGGPAFNLFAVNPDVRESDLTRLTEQELRGHWRGVQPEVIAAVTASGVDADVGGHEIWRTLAFCLLGMMATESCFATWVGRQR